MQVSTLFISASKLIGFTGCQQSTFDVHIVAVLRAVADVRNARRGCSCPPQFTRTGIRSNAPYCKRNSNVAKCSRKSFLELKGYDANINMYINPKRIGLTSCKASCLASCDCDGFYYDMATAFCHQTTRFRTLRKVNNQKKLVYIKM